MCNAFGVTELFEHITQGAPENRRPWAMVCNRVAVIQSCKHLHNAALDEAGFQFPQLAIQFGEVFAEVCGGRFEFGTGRGELALEVVNLLAQGCDLLIGDFSTAVLFGGWLRSSLRRCSADSMTWDDDSESSAATWNDSLRGEPCLIHALDKSACVTTQPRPGGVKYKMRPFFSSESSVGRRSPRSLIGSIRAARPRSSPTV